MDIHVYICNFLLKVFSYCNFLLFILCTVLSYSIIPRRFQQRATSLSVYTVMCHPL